MKSVRYLLFEQWHLQEPDFDPEIIPDKSSEWSCSWHFFLHASAESGSFPPEAVGAGAKNTAVPTFPLDTLPSPVMAEDFKEELEETLKVSLENSSVPLGLGFRIFGLVKSRVKLWGCDWGKFAAAETTFACGGAEIVTDEVNREGARFIVWSWGTERWGNEPDIGDEKAKETGPRRNLAWPVRLRREIAFLSFRTVASVRSEQSPWFEVFLCERRRIRCSILFNPCDAASCIAIWSSILGKLTRSTAMVESLKQR